MAIKVVVDHYIFLVPEADDPCDFWTSYYAKLKKALGRDNAKMVWLITWKSNGAASCAANPNFNRWLKKNNLEVSNITTRTLADLSTIGGNLFGLGKNMTKVLALGIPILLAVVLIGLIAVLHNTAKDSNLTDLAMLSPAGRSLKLIGK